MQPITSPKTPIVLTATLEKEPILGACRAGGAAASGAGAGSAATQSNSVAIASGSGAAGSQGSGNAAATGVRPSRCVQHLLL